MERKNLRSIVTAVIFAGILAFASVSFADDPLVVGPDVYKLKFENDEIRVMEITFVPGAKIATHSHPDHYVYMLTDGNLKLSYPDGTTKDLAGKAGDGMFIPAESHAAENVGTNEVKGLVFEIKPAVKK